VTEIEPFKPKFDPKVVEALRARLSSLRPFPPEQGMGWDGGMDLPYLQSLCRHWRDEYDFDRVPRALSAYPNHLWNGIHFLWARSDGDGLPTLLVHGWPGGVIEFLDMIPLLLDAGHDCIVPSLPGYGFSAVPESPLNVTGIAARLQALMEALGYERWALQGGDWGSPISARMALAAPERVAALHLNAVLLPAPAELSEPPLSEAEREFLKRAMRWRTREGFHLLVHSAAPDSLAAGLHDSPVGLAGWLVEKYRRWSDCGGEVERRFSKDDLCDFLTLYWATGTIAPSLRLYWAERRDRWRLGAGERIDVPAAVADFPHELVRPPREWAQRMLADLRSWTEMPRGGHFAAFEEPELLAEDVVAFLASVESK
jgi:pimeloyl-ACP methyl ester carboxylesterase